MKKLQEKERRKEDKIDYYNSKTYSVKRLKIFTGDVAEKSIKLVNQQILKPDFALR